MVNTFDIVCCKSPCTSCDLIINNKFSIFFFFYFHFSHLHFSVLKMFPSSQSKQQTVHSTSTSSVVESNTPQFVSHPATPFKPIYFINEEAGAGVPHFGTCSLAPSLSKRGTICSYSEDETLTFASDKHLCDSEVHNCVQEEMKFWMKTQLQLNICRFR